MQRRFIKATAIAALCVCLFRPKEAEASIILGTITAAATAVAAASGTILTVENVCNAISGICFVTDLYSNFNKHKAEEKIEKAKRNGYEPTEYGQKGE